MKANELRIGNYIGSNLADFPENYFTMVEVSEHACVLTEGLDWHPIRDRHYFECDDLEGIPLTEEWLLKFGAVKTFDNWQFTISVGAITLHFRRNNEWYSELGGIYLGSKIKYVHQLQNLYFALTGNELELK